MVRNNALFREINTSSFFSYTEMYRSLGTKGRITVCHGNSLADAVHIMGLKIEVSSYNILSGKSTQERIWLKRDTEKQLAACRFTFGE